MSWFYPLISVRHFPFLIRVTGLGALVAGAYGALHDQVSYSISPEYFTKMKFYQFAYADFGWPPRVFAAEVGFLATWWVGLIGGWILGRIGLAELTQQTTWSYTARAFALAAGVTVIVGALGALLGAAQARGDLSTWQAWQQNLGLDDLHGFVVVAYLHWASYLGGVLGVLSAAVYVKRALSDLPPYSVQPEGR